MESAAGELKTEIVPSTEWDVRRSAELYRVQSWGAGYFALSPNGSLVVRSRAPRPEQNGDYSSPQCDLHALVTSLKQRGIDLPILFRFDGILRDRVNFIQTAFDDAIREVGYRGTYRLAYPLKVNQQRHVVESILQAGRQHGLGLQVGSKAELLAVLPIHDAPGALLLCNGFKDDEYIELALMARTLGRRSIIVIEQPSELERVLKVSAQLGIEAELGVRIKPSVKGVYGDSILTDKSKFGLTPHELVTLVETLKDHGKIEWVKMLHFHMGTQITSIVAIKKVLKEACRIYVELAKLCPAIHIMNVGGGLAVDYDGSNTNFEGSMNYSVDEYARDIVYAIEEACREAEIPNPDIISESGRAVTAHHSMLVVEVTDVAHTLPAVDQLETPPSDHESLIKLKDLYRDLTLQNCVETLHDALEVKEELLERFIQGDLNVVERGYAERVIKHLLAKIREVSKGLDYTPEEMERLDDDLKDLYFCNFSVFQSIPDSWAANQLFPIVPINFLDRKPTRPAMIVDLTCDSDGKISRFIDLKDVSPHVLFHVPDSGTPYYIGIFLIGAYQEILGDLHNLFGDTHAVHVNITDDGRTELTHVVEGDRIREVLSYVQYDAQDLLERLRVSIEEALKKGLLQPDESAKLQKRFKEALDGYTYLVK
ncbi:MAG: biosynthetic arginine decarboxylase [Oligoflexia bacterium]|nr:biosynthetic arginine decarboxylase [Oligoflexia bacterium]